MPPNKKMGKSGTCERTGAVVFLYVVLFQDDSDSDPNMETQLRKHNFMRWDRGSPYNFLTSTEVPARSYKLPHPMNIYYPKDMVG